MKIYESIIALFLAYIIHEFSHYIAFALFGYYPKITSGLFHTSVGDTIVWKLTVGQFQFIAFSGVVAGFLFLSIVQASTTILLIYLFISSMDIFNFVRLIKYDSRKTMLWVTEFEYYEVLFNAKKKR